MWLEIKVKPREGQLLALATQHWVVEEGFFPWSS
jgi:hypothetical protein